MKKGIIAVLPNLVLHVLVFLFLLGVIFGLIGFFLSNPENAEAENELVNFVSAVEGLADGDRENHTVYFASEGDFVIVMLSDERVVRAQTNIQTGRGNNIGSTPSPPQTLRNPCRDRCLCAYVPTPVDLQEVACERVSVDVVSAWTEFVLEKNAGTMTYVTPETPVDGYVPLLLSNAGNTDSGRLLTLTKQGDVIVVS